MKVDKTGIRRISGFLTDLKGGNSYRENLRKDCLDKTDLPSIAIMNTPQQRLKGQPEMLFESGFKLLPKITYNYDNFLYFWYRPGRARDTYEEDFVTYYGKNPIQNNFTFNTIKSMLLARFSIYNGNTFNKTNINITDTDIKNFPLYLTQCCLGRFANNATSCCGLLEFNKGGYYDEKYLDMWQGNSKGLEFKQEHSGINPITIPKNFFVDNLISNRVNPLAIMPGPKNSPSLLKQMKIDGNIRVCEYVGDDDAGFYISYHKPKIFNEKTYTKDLYFNCPIAGEFDEFM